MKTELLGLPIIKGEKHHLKAISKDLIKLGYKFVQGCDKQGTNIRINNNLQSDIYTMSDGMELWWDSYDDHRYTGGDINIPIETFNLPQDWSKALEFMRENMVRWNKIQEENKQPEFKVGDIVVVMKSPTRWASGLKGKCPFGEINFPLLEKLMKLEMLMILVL